jgi:putative restriction endonuclease
MKSGQRLWTEDELILTINLYAKLPFGKMHHRNKEVQELAKLINRTPDSVARRLGNFASLDPVQQGRGIKGLSNAGSLTEKVWSKFYNDWDNSFEESERLLAGYRRINTEQLYPIDIINEVGLEKERLVKTRLNQYRFRLMVLSNYNTTCCITGI